MNTIFSLALVGLAVALTVKILNDLDFNKVVYSHAPGKCRYVDGIDTPGSEDLILLSNGLALISSGVYFPLSSVKSKPGKIYIYDTSKDGGKAQPLAIKSDHGWKSEEFFPLGITAWEEKGETTVFCINSFTHQIHVFELKISEKQLVHKKTVGHPSISNPNNLIAISKDKFYLSNFVYYANPVGQILEFTQKLAFGSVWFYDGSKFVQVLDGLKGPNGIAVSKSKKFLYVATHLDESLRVYRIEPSPSNINLTLINAMNLYTGVDNVNVDSQGSLWIGAHPIAYKAIKHMFNHEHNSAPSQVLKITFNIDHSKWKMEEVFADDGSALSCSTVAALTPDGRKLLIGTLFHKTMICEIGHYDILDEIFDRLVA